MLEVVGIKSKISECVVFGKFGELQAIQNELIQERMEQNKFFSDFFGVDVYHEMEVSDDTDTPMWKEYKAKVKEYQDISSLLSLCNYYSNRYSNVQ